MQTVDTLIHARWIIPVEPAGVVYEHSCLAVNEGRIVELLPSAETGQKYRAGNVVPLERHALIPGLINAHTHAAMSLFRGLADDLPLMVWLNEHIWPAEGRWVDAPFAADGSELAIAEMIRGGITCFSDMYFFPEETARVAARCGMRAMIGLITIDFPTVWAAHAEEYLSKGLALHDEYRDHPLIRTAFAPHAPYTVSNKPLQRIQMLADELDLPIHIHVHETSDEIGHSLDSHGIRPLQRLEQLNLLSPRLIAVHMTQLNDEEIADVGASGAHVVHCPESNLKLASGFCPVQKLLDAGANVALGTDGAASNNDLDMFGEMRTAALLAKAVAHHAAAVPAATALRMATLNGARALGWEEQIGSLCAGKYADLTAVDMGEIEALPVYDPISHLVYATGRHAVSDVWVAGRRLLSNRQLTTMDESAIKQQAQTWGRRIQQRD